MAYKTQLVDKVGTFSAMLIALGFLFTFFIFIIAGAAGPGTVVRMSLPLLPLSNTTCNNPYSCVVSVGAQFTGLSSYNQFVVATASLQRPTNLNTGLPAALSGSFSFDLTYTLNAWSTDNSGVISIINSNATHVLTMYCPANQLYCTGNSFVQPIFSQTFLTQPSYTFFASFQSPLAPFAAAVGGNLSSNVVFQLDGTYLNDQYTRFELGSKYFFFAMSLITFSVYTYFLRNGAGSIDPRDPTKRLKSTSEQSWVWWLSFLLIWYNDPFFAITLLQPNIAAAGFTAVSTVTFLAALLFYWLVQFDLSRLQGLAGGETSSQEGATGWCARYCNLSAIGAALCFWIPKILLIAFFWLASLSLYMWTRIMQITDPAYNVYEAFPQQAAYFNQFATAIGVFYVLYLLVLMFMGFATCKRMKPSARFPVAVTIIAIFITVITIFMQAYTAERQNAAAFMCAYAIANCYVWFLMISFLPLYEPSPADLVEKSESGVKDITGLNQLVQHNIPLDGVGESKAIDLLEAGVQTDFGTEAEFIAVRVHARSEEEIPLGGNEAVPHDEYAQGAEEFGEASAVAPPALPPRKGAAAASVPSWR
jgi:Wnt-binding factor required for Wnt secretion